jgi:3,4-dihydroxy 2-butanone 4-phosphate synthase/GTP cyclohydrolase II
VSIDYKPDGGTGISAEERASCCRALANPNAGAADFARPGHVFPLIAREGGVLFRSGHTEAAVDLCRLCGLPPVGVISELMNDDGSVMKGEQVAHFAAGHKLKHVTIADLIAYRQAREKLIERVSTFTMESPIGPLQGYAYRSPFDEITHAAFVYNGIGDGKRVLTRLHKPNIVKDLFTGSERMQVVLRHFKRAGRGVLVYLRDGAAGVPIEPMGETRTAEADRHRQWREVGVGAQILRDLGVTSIINLTSSVHDYKGLSGFGIEIVASERLEF